MSDEQRGIARIEAGRGVTQEEATYVGISLELSSWEIKRQRGMSEDDPERVTRAGRGYDAAELAEASRRRIEEIRDELTAKGIADGLEKDMTVLETYARECGAGDRDIRIV